MILAFTLEDSASAFRFLLQASSGQSGNTSEVKASHRPSRDQITSSAPAEMRVSFRASPPDRSIIQICGAPSRAETNAILRPSGDQRGVLSRFSLCVNCRAFPPARGTIQISLLPALFSLLYRAAEYATHLPSGEICGSATRAKPIRSSKVIG